MKKEKLSSEIIRKHDIVLVEEGQMINKNVLCLVDPRAQGGVETFGRNLQKIFKGNVYFYTYGEGKKENIYRIDNIYELHKKKYHPKFIRKKLQLNDQKKYIKNLVENNNIEICIINYFQDIKLIEDLDIIKVFVQHNPADFYFNRNIFPHKNKDLSLLIKTFDYCDKIITLSPQDAEEFKLNMPYHENKIEFIRHISHLDIFKGEKKAEKKLIMICRIEKQKRVDLAIKAMDKLQDYTLEIYGDGSEVGYIKNLINNSLYSNIYFQGITNDVVDKLDNNSIFIMTSDYEGYGITNIEAIRRGLPLVVRDTFTSAADIVDGNGILLSKNWNEDEFVNAVKNVYENYYIYRDKNIILSKKYDVKIARNKWGDMVV